MAKRPTKRGTKKNVPATTKSNVPAFMEKYSSEGKENISNDDIEIPRIVLSQAVSEQVVDGGHPAGQFFHTALEETLGEELRLVPVYHQTRYVLWNPRHEGGGILARADDGVNWNNGDEEFEVKPYKGQKTKVKWRTGKTVGKNVGLGAWGTYEPGNSDSPPAATRSCVLIVYAPERPELGPMALILQRSGEPVARKLLSKLQFGDIPIYGRIFKASAVVQSGDEGDFYNYKFTSDGLIQDEGEFMKLRDMYLNFKSLGVMVRDEEGVQADDAEEPSTGKGRSF